MTNVVAMPVYGKVHLANLFLRHQEIDDLQTWHTASGMRTVQSLFKWWSWVELDIFYSKVNFALSCFCMVKCLLAFIDIIEEYELKVGTVSWLSVYMNTFEYQMSRSLFNFFPRSLRYLLSDILPYWPYCWTHQRQMLCRAFMIRWNKIFFKWWRLHGQDGCYAHMWLHL